jgi:predicted DNA-binding helix-hairpin-helix protein
MFHEQLRQQFESKGYLHLKIIFTKAEVENLKEASVYIPKNDVNMTELKCEKV